MGFVVAVFICAWLLQCRLEWDMCFVFFKCGFVRCVWCAEMFIWWTAAVCSFGGDGADPISASSYVEQLRTDLRQQAPPDRGRTLQFELQALLLKASKNGKLSLVDIAWFLTLQVGHESGGWFCKDDIVSNIVDKLIGKLPDTSAAASAPAMGFVFALKRFCHICNASRLLL